MHVPGMYVCICVCRPSESVSTGFYEKKAFKLLAGKFEKIISGLLRFVAYFRQPLFLSTRVVPGCVMQSPRTAAVPGMILRCIMYEQNRYTILVRTSTICRRYSVRKREPSNTVVAATKRRGDKPKLVFFRERPFHIFFLKFGVFEDAAQLPISDLPSTASIISIHRRWKL